MLDGTVETWFRAVRPDAELWDHFRWYGLD
jgi:hypothetical protein